MKRNDKTFEFILWVMACSQMLGAYLEFVNENYKLVPWYAVFLLITLWLIYNIHNKDKGNENTI